jgi:hypothetical protein
MIFYQLNTVFFMGFDLCGGADVRLFYGPLAVVFSPGKTWFVLWAISALYKHRWSASGMGVDIEPVSPSRVGMVTSKIRDSLRRLRGKKEDVLIASSVVPNELESRPERRRVVKDTQ